MMKTKALFIVPNFSSFNQDDIDIFNELFELKVLGLTDKRKWVLPFQLLKEFFWLLFNLPSSKIVIVSFGGYFSVLPTLMSRIMAKKSYVILHGTDASSMPEIGYGRFRHPPMSWALKISYRMASALLPVGSCLVKRKDTYTDIVGSEQGVKVFMPKLKTPMQVVENGISLEQWESKKVSVVPNSFVSVVTRRALFQLKGIDLVIDAAVQFEDCHFNIVGMEKPDGMNVPKNVVFHGFQDRDGLKNIYQKTQFILMLSITESYNRSLLEAMYCGCVPIASAVSCNPAIVEDRGYLLRKRDLSDLIELLKAAIQDYTPEKGIICKEWVKNNNSLEHRKRKLEELLLDN